MATDIDSLQIQINAQATKANDAIDRLVSKLDRLTASLSSIDGSKLNGLANGVQHLGTAMQTMNNVKTADFTRLAKNLTALNNIDTSKLSGVSTNITAIGQSLSGLNGVSDGAKQLAELANGIKQLGYKSAGQAIKNIPQLATAMKQLMTELSKAPKVSQNLIDMTNALAKLARTGASSGKAAQSLSNSFTGIYKSSGFAVSGIKKVNARLVSLIRSIAPVVGLVKLIDFGKQAMEISSDLTEVQNVVDVTFGDYKHKIEDLASVSIPELGMSELSVKEIGSRFQAMGTAMGFSTEKMSDMSVELTRLTGDMASFYNVEQETMGKALQSIFTGETEPMRKYGIDLTNATIQQYALSQGITTSINKMTQLEKAQLRYNYVMAQTTAAQGDFIRTQDTWANQIRILKQNLQQLASIIGGTLINAFKPLVQAINSAMSHIIAFAQTVSNALGKIFGWKFEVGGGGVTNDLETGAGAADDIASGMGEAADNAKKLRSHLLAIDELNVYEPTEDSSASGSSGSGLGNLGGGGASGGEWVQQDSVWKNFESEIDSLYELGEYIGKVLTDMMNSIDWEAVYEKARNFGTGLADFLNGLISPELFGAVGRTIAGALNTAIYAALAFGERFDWKDFGLSLATGLNEFFLTFDFASLAAAINVWVKGILDTIIVFLEKTDWKMIGEKIGTFLAEIDFLDIGMKVGKAIWEAINAGFEMLGGMFSKAPFETIILSVAAFKGAWDKLIKVKVVPWINKITKALKGFGNAILALSGSQKALSALIVDFPKLGSAVDVARKSFANFQFGIENGNLFSGLSLGIKTIRDNLTGLQKGVIAAVAAFAEFNIVSDSFQSITEGSENLIAEITKISATVAAAGAAMTLVLGFPAGVIATGIIGLIGAIKGINDGIESLQLNSMFETIQTTGTVSLEVLGSVAKSAFESITVGLDTTIEKLNSVSQTRESIDGTVESIDGIRLAVENGAYNTAEKIPEIISQFQSLLDQSKQLFNEEYDVIVGNIVGAQADILEAQGQSVPLMIANLAKLRDEGNSAYSELEASMASLVEQYNNGTISEAEFLDQFTPLYEQLKGVNSDGSINAAADSIRNMGSALDMSQYIYDNTFQVSEFQAEVDGVVQAAKDGKDGLLEAAEGYNATLEDMKNQLEAFGIDTSGFDWSAAYGASEEQVSQGISDIESAYTEYANQIQYHLLEQLPSVVENATKDYENLSSWQKLFTTKEDYVQGEVNQWKDNILNPATSTLQSGFEQLGIDGETWASTAATKMTDSLFGEIQDSMDMGVETTTTYLKSDWETILDNALSGAAEAVGAESYGKDTVDGYNKGVKDNAATTNEAISKWMNDIPTTIHNSDLKFGSPSKTAEEYGKWTIDGFNLGITNNQDSTRTAIESWMGTISTAMEEKWNEIKEWWNNTALVSFFDESIIPNFGYDKWYEILGNGMFLAFQDKWNEFYTWWSEEIMPLWNEEQVEPNFGHDKWYEFLGNGMFLAFSEHIKMFLENWKQSISKWWKEDVEPWFKKEKWIELLQKVKDAFKESFTAVKENTKTIMDEMLEIVKSVVDEAVAKIGEIKTAAEEALGVIDSLASKISGLSGGGISLNVSGFSMPKFATGGVVTRPTIGLFGESGAEAIVPLEKNAGWISSVADQLESYGSKDSEELLREQNELLRQQNELLSYLADKEIVATLDTSRETINGLRSAERRLGYSFT